ncbi:MAG: solute carrier family 26 protein [Phycisphaerales bacterium]|nr:MAG: solute carrier family 26 protein [Phycisphaerales bacterium]
MAAIRKVLPILDWLGAYKRADLRADASAGLTVAVMLVPQAMAYAMLAGLPPAIGLYASSLPLIAYALLGSSRHLAVGPVAMISLIVFSACSRVAEPGSAQYIATALLLAFLVGAMQLLAGILRLGSLVNFISGAVISGFTSAAAIVICLSQLKHLLGIKLTTTHSVFHLLLQAGRNLGQTHLASLTIGALTIGGLILFRKKFPHFPAAFIFVIAGTLIVYLLGPQRLGVQTVGEVPRGLPSFSVPKAGLDSIRHLFPAAMAIFLVGYVESISVARYVAAREKYKIDPNQELRGLGLANLAGAFFSGYPVTGGFSRTAVNYRAGARTALASIITAVVIIVTVLFLTPLFYYLPNAVLAAIIMVAVASLIDIKEAVHFFIVKKTDGWVLAITFASTLTLGIEQGILIGVASSLVVFIWHSSHPHTAELGYLEKDKVFRNVRRFPEVRTFPDVLILRADASLYFANAKFLEDRLRDAVAEKANLKWVIVDMSGVNDIDAVAVDTLEEIIKTYGEHGITFAFAAVKGPVRDVVARAGWEGKYGRHIGHASISEALREIGIWTENDVRGPEQQPGERPP